MADPFMEEMQKLFDAGDYGKILTAWGAETSNSVEFKQGAFAGYTPTKHDVIVSTYPKSGTTWMMQMAHQISFLGEGDFKHQYDVVHWPDKLVPIEDNIEIDDMSVVEASPSSMRVIKSHLETDFIPYAPEAKYISVIRDPKDLLVSAAMFENGFNKMLFGDIVPIDSFVDSFLSNSFIYQPWHEFIHSWWAINDRDNVLVVTYEEMKADANAMIQRVSDLMGVSLTEEQSAKVLDKTSFKYMKDNEDKFAQPAWEEGFVPLLRSGQSGNAKELLTLEQQQRIDRHFLDALKKIGSSFPYADKFKVTV